MEQKIKLGNAYFVKNEPDNYTKSTTKSADGKKITVVNVVNGTEQAPFDFQGGSEVPTDVARTGQENTFTKDQHFKNATDPVVVDMDNLNVDGDTTLDDLQVNGDATFVNAVVVGQATSDNHAIRKKQVDDNFIKKTEKAVANGVASLDGSGKIPLAQLNDAIVGQLVFGGNCEKTGTPEILKAYPSSDLKDKLGITDNEIQLIDSDTDDTTTTPKKYGYKTLKKVFFLCRNSFTAKGEGGTTVTFKIGDWLIGTGTYWDRIENTDTVVSVNGKDGVVVLKGSDIQVSATNTDTIDTALGKKVAKATTTDEHTHIYGFNKAGETTVDLTSELGNKLSKVATTSTKDQMYVKKADGLQAMVDVPTIPTKTSELTNDGSDGNSQYIDGLFGTTDPTTATKGYFLGQIYTNKTNGKVFILKGLDNTTPKYDWYRVKTTKWVEDIETAQDLKDFIDLKGVQPIIDLIDSGSTIQITNTMKLGTDNYTANWKVVHATEDLANYGNTGKKGVILQLDGIVGGSTNGYKFTKWDTTDNFNYDGSLVKTFINGDFVAFCDTDFTNVLKSGSCKVGTKTGGATSYTATDSSFTKFFLPSAKEVMASGDNQVENEGEEWLWYKKKIPIASTNSNIYRKKTFIVNNTSYSLWWLRSPRIDNTNIAWLVSFNGYVGNNYVYSTNRGVAPACLIF